MASLIPEEFRAKSPTPNRRVAQSLASPANTTLPKFIDYPELRALTKDYDTTIYGPHQCSGCYVQVVKTSIEEGAYAWERFTEWKPSREMEGSSENFSKVPVHSYKPHMCPQVRFYKKLAGKVLTILDASFPEGSKQAKAMKDLLRREFRAIIELAAMESGHGGENGEEGCGEGESLC